MELSVSLPGDYAKYVAPDAVAAPCGRVEITGPSGTYRCNEQGFTAKTVHAGLRSHRLYLEAKILGFLGGENICDIGACFDRAAFLLRWAPEKLRTWSFVAPSLLGGDTKRIKELRAAITYGLISKEQVFEEEITCDNVGRLIGNRHAMLVHSVYYLNADILQAIVNHCHSVQREVYLVMHPLNRKGVIGLTAALDAKKAGIHRFAWGKRAEHHALLTAIEAKIERFDNTPGAEVHLTAGGNATPYIHGYTDWVWDAVDCWVGATLSLDRHLKDGKKHGPPKGQAPLLSMLIRASPSSRAQLEANRAFAVNATRTLLASTPDNMVSNLMFNVARELAARPVVPNNVREAVAEAMGTRAAFVDAVCSSNMPLFERLRYSIWRATGGWMENAGEQARAEADIAKGAGTMLHPSGRHILRAVACLAAVVLVVFAVRSTSTAVARSRLAAWAGRFRTHWTLLRSWFGGGGSATASMGSVYARVRGWLFKPAPVAAPIANACEAWRAAAKAYAGVDLQHLRQPREPAVCVNETAHPLPPCSKQAVCPGVQPLLPFPVTRYVYHTCERTQLQAYKTRSEAPHVNVDEPEDFEAFWLVLRDIIGGRLPKVRVGTVAEWLTKYTGEKLRKKKQGVGMGPRFAHQLMVKRELTGKTMTLGRGDADPRPIVMSDPSLAPLFGPSLTALNNSLIDAEYFEARFGLLHLRVYYAIGLDPLQLGRMFDKAVAFAGRGARAYPGDFSRFDARVQSWQNERCWNLKHEFARDTYDNEFWHDLSRTELRIGERKFNYMGRRRSGDDCTTVFNTLLQLMFWMYLGWRGVGAGWAPLDHDVRVAVLIGGDDSLGISATPLSCEAAIATAGAWGWKLEVEETSLEGAEFYSGLFCGVEVQGHWQSAWINKPGRVLAKLSGSASDAATRNPLGYLAGIAVAMDGAWVNHPFFSELHALLRGAGAPAGDHDEFYLVGGGDITAYDVLFFERRYGCPISTIRNSMIRYVNAVAAGTDPFKDFDADLLARLVAESGFEGGSPAILQKRTSVAEIAALTLPEEIFLWALHVLFGPWSNVLFAVVENQAYAGLGWSLGGSRWTDLVVRLAIHRCLGYARNHSLVAGIVAHVGWNVFATFARATLACALRAPYMREDMKTTTHREAAGAGQLTAKAVVKPVAVKPQLTKMVEKAVAEPEKVSTKRERRSNKVDARIGGLGYNLQVRGVASGQDRIAGILRRALIDWKGTAFSQLRGEFFPLEGGPLPDFSTTEPTAWVPLSEAAVITSDGSNQIRMQFLAAPNDVLCMGAGTAVFGVPGVTPGCFGFSAFQKIEGSGVADSLIEAYRVTGFRIKIQAICSDFQNQGTVAVAFAPHQAGIVGYPSSAQLSTFPYRDLWSVSHLQAQEECFVMLFASTQGSNGAYIRDAFQDLYDGLGALIPHNIFAPTIYLAADGVQPNTAILRITLEMGVEGTLETRSLVGGSNAINAVGPTLSANAQNQMAVHPAVQQIARESANGDSFVGKALKFAKREGLAAWDEAKPIIDEMGGVLNGAKKVGAYVADLAPFLAALL